MITLGTLAQATEQEVFNQVATHLLTQMEQCTGKTTCQYRSDDGKLKCAAGCLISEDEMLQIHATSNNEASWNCLIASQLVPKTHEGLIQELQSVHDDNKDPSEWYDILLEVAEQRNLIMPKI